MSALPHYLLPPKPPIDPIMAFSCDEWDQFAAQGSLKLFSRRMFPNYITAAHIDELDAALEWAVSTPNARLIVTLPPRHSKSLNVSEHLPAWFLGNHPDQRIIGAAHSASLAYTFSRRVRNKITDYRWPFPNVTIAEDKGAVQAWDIQGHQGGYVAVGVGGSPTGQGGDCLAAGTMVRTDAGIIDIQHLVRLQYQCKVLAFDHVSGEPVWRRIEAAREVYSDDIYEITTTAGRSFRSTGSHRVYVNQSEYREARFLRPGDRLTVSSEPITNNVSGVWRGEGWARSVLQLMHAEGAAGALHLLLLNMRSGCRTAETRVPQDAIARGSDGVLQRRLQARGNNSAQHLRANEFLSMRQSHSSQSGEVLFGRMRNSIRKASNSFGPNMPRVRNGVPSHQQHDDVLLEGMREQFTRVANDWLRKLQLQNRFKLCEMVPGYASFDSGTRSTSMRGVQDDRTRNSFRPKRTNRTSHQLAYPSHQRNRLGQHGGKSSGAVREMSSPTTQQDAVLRVVRVRGASIPVYDIQVEGCRNFFANDVLVHNCIIIDDPIRSAADAESQTVRDALWEWYQGTLRTRLEPGGSMIVTATRWHQDDLTGRLLAAEAAGGEQWRHLHMPAISDAGEALWPERWPLDALELIRSAVGPRVFEAQYQGRPSPAEGDTLKRQWWKFWSERPALTSFDSLIQSWDMTFRETARGSFVVGQVWGAIGADRYLLAQTRLRTDFPGSVAAMRELSADWPLTREKLVENKANGPAIVATLQHEIPGLIEVQPEGGKEARANAVAWQIEAGNVYLPDPKRHPWVTDFIEECAAFPNGANDDQVDAMTQALRRLYGVGNAMLKFYAAEVAEKREKSENPPAQHNDRLRANLYG